MLSLQEAVRHPVTIVSSGLAAASQLFQIPFIDALVAVVWTQASTLFSAISILAFSVFPNVDLGGFAFLTSSVRTLALILAVVYAGKLAYQAYKSFDNRLDNQ